MTGFIEEAGSVAKPESGFKWFAGGSRGARSFPTCSLTKSGSMTLNDVAVEMLGEPEAVQIGYNPERKQVGMRISERGEPGALALRPVRKPDGTESGSRSIYARSVLMYYGLLPEENGTFRLTDIGDDVYALSLSDPLPRSRTGRPTHDK